MRIVPIGSQIKTLGQGLHFFRLGGRRTGNFQTFGRCSLLVLHDITLARDADDRTNVIQSLIYLGLYAAFARQLTEGRRILEEALLHAAALRDDLMHLDEVQIPDYPSDTGGRAVVSREHLVNTAVIIGVLVVLAALGVAAELVHRAQVGP